MRAFALIFALALPLLAAAQCADGVDALCCFDSQDPTIDNLTQLGNLQNTTLPTDVPGSIGLLCSSLDDTCTDQQLCCSDNGFNGVLALGCAATTPSTS
ncbi:hypothetical protein BDZ97DRAFT_1920647 [Flammula alnicola]|nr:hypothetical protein BDZ97DRAFT_1925119 [Flammula alnicola]KAF8962175.1 hypothetical protein BDZ97DRAFT_1920647 [Flammula alnicola]